MPRRRRRPPIRVILVLPSEAPTQDEIDVILLAADAIVGQAGRSGLTLILNGSRSQKALEWEWDKLPDYGALRHLTAKEIGYKVDWCIHHGWLRLEHNRDGIPLLYHSSRGWERVKQLWVERLLVWFEEWQRAGQPERVWSRCCRRGFLTRSGRCGWPSTVRCKTWASGRYRTRARIICGLPR